MYTPQCDREDRAPLIRSLVEQHNFATLVSGSGVPVVSHLPFLWDERGPHGTLVSHMARANPHWRAFEGTDSVVIVQGPHAYVSPAWYEPSPENLPTWNYAAAHLWGVPRIIDGEAAAYAVMQRLVRAHEDRYATGWQLQLSDQYRRAMLAKIVVFEIQVRRVEAKFKLSQQDTANRQRVAAELSAGSDQAQRETGELMRWLSEASATS